MNSGSRVRDKRTFVSLCSGSANSSNRWSMSVHPGGGRVVPVGPKRGSLTMKDMMSRSRPWGCRSMARKGQDDAAERRRSRLFNRCGGRHGSDTQAFGDFLYEDRSRCIYCPVSIVEEAPRLRLYRGTQYDTRRFQKSDARLQSGKNCPNSPALWKCIRFLGNEYIYVPRVSKSVIMLSYHES